MNDRLLIDFQKNSLDCVIAPQSIKLFVFLAQPCQKLFLKVRRNLKTYNLIPDFTDMITLFFNFDANFLYYSADSNS
jgi:hypothetical protein